MSNCKYSAESIAVSETLNVTLGSINSRLDSIDIKLDNIDKAIHYKDGIDSRIEKLEVQHKEERDTKYRLVWLAVGTICSSPMLTFIIHKLGWF